MAAGDNINPVSVIDPVACKKPTIVVSLTPYADGEGIGGLITLEDIVANATGSGTLTRLGLKSLVAIGSKIFVHVFDANPSASTFTDNAAMVIHANDRAKNLYTFEVASTDWAVPKGASPWYTAELINPPGGKPVLDFELASGRNLYLAIEADGAITFVSTADLAAVAAAS